MKAVLQPHPLLQASQSDIYYPAGACRYSCVSIRNFCFGEIILKYSHTQAFVALGDGGSDGVQVVGRRKILEKKGFLQRKNFTLDSVILI
jgi:hypothetical protein